MTRMVHLVAAVVAALLSVPSASAISLATPDVVSHMYSSHYDCAALSYTTTERGPPKTRNGHTNYDAVDGWSRGTSPRSNEPTPAPACAYDHPALLVSAASATTPAGGLVVVVDGDLSSRERSSVAAKGVTRSLDELETLRGASPAEIEALIPAGWVKSATNVNKGGLGARYSNPERLGEQIRVMPGKATDPNPIKQGPYLRISRNGSVSDPIPLEGNPTW